MPSVAIIGASNDPAKYGNRAVRAYLRRGWTVHPVNPGDPTVEGLLAEAERLGLDPIQACSIIEIGERP